MLAVLRSGGARAGILVLGCSMVGHVANYLFYVVAARSLTPAQFADISAMTALGTITFMPATGIQAAAARDTASLRAWHRFDEADGLVRWLARRVALVQVVLLAVLLLATPAAVSILGLSSASVWMVGAVWLVLGLGLQIGLGPLQGRDRFGAVGTALAGPMGAFRPLLLVPCIAAAGVAGALGALALATVFGVVGVLIVLWKPLRNRTAARVALTGTLPALVALIAFASLTNADVLAAKVLLAPTAAGLYASAALLGKIALYAPSALALVLLPKVTARFQAGLDVRGPALLTMAATVGTGLLVVAVIFAAPPSVVSLVFGPDYSSAYRLAAPIAVVMTVSALLQVHLMMALASGRRITIWLTAGAAVAQILGLTLAGHTAGHVVLITGLASGSATLLHEVLSPYGAVRLLRRGATPAPDLPPVPAAAVALAVAPSSTGNGETDES